MSLSCKFSTESWTADAHREGFDALYNLVVSSLDFYREDLEQVLFPVFVHLFLSLVGKKLCAEA